MNFTFEFFYLFQVTNLGFNGDGKLIVATMGKPAEIVTWRFNHFKQDLAITKNIYQELFKADGNFYFNSINSFTFCCIIV
jgi:hypothetical protein